jgi:hypothetical protein
VEVNSLALTEIFSDMWLDELRNVIKPYYRRTRSCAGMPNMKKCYPIDCDDRWGDWLLWDKTKDNFLNRCTEHFNHVRDIQQMRINSILLRLLVPLHVSASRCHLQGVTISLFISYSRLSAFRVGMDYCSSSVAICCGIRQTNNSPHLPETQTTWNSL